MKKTTKYILEDKQEIETIKYCLNYCVHRKREHNKLPFLRTEVLENLRRDMGIIN